MFFILSPLLQVSEHTYFCLQHLAIMFSLPLRQKSEPRPIGPQKRRVVFSFQIWESSQAFHKLSGSPHNSTERQSVALGSQNKIRTEKLYSVNSASPTTMTSIILLEFSFRNYLMRVFILTLYFPNSTINQTHLHIHCE